jgi:plasmid maintenance system antidote protein VapI
MENIKGVIALKNANTLIKKQSSDTSFRSDAKFSEPQENAPLTKPLCDFGTDTQLLIQVFAKLLQLKLELEKYIVDGKYDPALNFGYFFNEYIRIQGKPDKQIALEMGVTDAAISQLINHHRKPTKEFIIRLELHSGGMFFALLWFKLLNKEKEYEIATDVAARIAASRYVKTKLTTIF